jgi:hypothetical protein
MTHISAYPLAPLLLPAAHDFFHLRLPATLVPPKLKTATLLNALAARLRSAFAEEVPCTLYCHGDDKGRAQLTAEVAGVRSGEMKFAQHDFTYYGSALAARQGPGIALFLTQQERPHSPLVERYSQSLWRFDSRLPRELQSWAKDPLQGDHELFYPGCGLEKSLYADMGSGEFSLINCAKLCRNFFSSSLSKIAQGGAEAHDEAIFHAGWGLYGQSWSGDGEPARKIAGVEFRLAAEQLSFDSVAQITTALSSWLQEQLGGDLEKIPRIVLAVPSLALFAAFTRSLKELHREFRYKLVYPDFAFGWAPLHNYLSLWAGADMHTILINAGDFPRIQCYLAT